MSRYMCIACLSVHLKIMACLVLFTDIFVIPLAVVLSVRVCRKPNHLEFSYINIYVQIVLVSVCSLFSSTDVWFFL